MNSSYSTVFPPNSSVKLPTNDKFWFKWIQIALLTIVVILSFALLKAIDRKNQIVSQEEYVREGKTTRNIQRQLTKKSPAASVQSRPKPKPVSKAVSAVRQIKK